MVEPACNQTQLRQWDGTLERTLVSTKIRSHKMPQSLVLFKSDRIVPPPCILRRLAEVRLPFLFLKRASGGIKANVSIRVEQAASAEAREASK